MRYENFVIKNRWLLAQIRDEFYVESRFDEHRKLIYMIVTNGLSAKGSDDGGRTAKRYYIQKPNFVEKMIGITHENKISRMENRLQKICDKENKIIRKHNIENYKKIGW